MSIGRICSRIVHTAEPRETVHAAAARMQQNNVGTLVVVDATQHPVGILTDRDLVVRVMTAGRQPTTTCVEEVMTHYPRTLTEQTPVEDALASMRQLGVRRLPVVGDDGQLVGLLSVDDVLELLAAELGNIGRVIAQSTGGAVAPAAASDRPARRQAAEGIERAAGDPEC